MNKKVLILESPNKARQIDRICLEKSSDIVVTATYGHIMDLPKNEMGVFQLPDDKISFKLTVMKNRTHIVRDLKLLCMDADVIIATDPDREGEAIAWHIKNQVGKICKSIQKIDVQAINKENILSALETPRSINAGRVKAQAARRIIDRLIGYTLTPMAATALNTQKRSSASIGRVQSAITNMIKKQCEKVDREPLTTTFQTIFQSIDGTSFTSSHFKEKEEAESILESLQSLGVKTLENRNEKEKENPPKPLTSAMMISLAYEYFNWAPVRTMSVAQSLFEGSLISYHRTDSVRVEKDTSKRAREYLSSIDPEIIPESPLVYKNNRMVQDAHEAIHPVSFEEDFNPQHLKRKSIITKDRLHLYTLIWKYFLASQTSPAIWNILHIYIGNSKCRHRLKSSGKSLLKTGWRTLIPGEKSPLSFSSQGYIKGTFYVNPQSTKKIKEYNYGTLVHEMSERGIGRPSTYAGSISKILSKGYVSLDGDHIKITEKGDRMLSWLAKTCPGIMDPMFTADMEDRLDDVEAGTRIWDDPVKKVMSVLSKINDEDRHFTLEDREKTIFNSCKYIDRC